MQGVLWPTAPAAAEGGGGGSQHESGTADARLMSAVVPSQARLLRLYDATEDVRRQRVGSGDDLVLAMNRSDYMLDEPSGALLQVDSLHVWCPAQALFADSGVSMCVACRHMRARCASNREVPPEIKGMDALMSWQLLMRQPASEAYSGMVRPASLVTPASTAG